jgi:hypothetical protein
VHMVCTLTLSRIIRFLLSDVASSVDVERAFSGDCLTIGDLQHSMGDLTFEA